MKRCSRLTTNESSHLIKEGMENLESPRLRLRLWKQSDLDPFIEMNQDERVMEFMPSCLNTEQTKILCQKIQNHFQKHGFGLYALELKESEQFIGFLGLWEVDFEASFTPAFEIGWRVAYPFWNQGFATEGGRRVLEFAFSDLALPKVVSFTTLGNQRSRRVMEKLGLTFKGIFNHPKLSPDDPLSSHVLYEIHRNYWMNQKIQNFQI